MSEEQGRGLSPELEQWFAPANQMGAMAAAMTGRRLPYRQLVG